MEQGLSANKKTVTPDRASLSDVTINGLRTVEDHVKLYGEPRNVHITSELLQATRKAHKAYGKIRLMNEKEELLRWRETKAKIWREGKTTGSTEVGTKETKLV